uniref:Carboxypeptidase regulatory-like domain-containing protein n=1 Tax=Prevotella sp. GTC17259 TaxID=3236795 RepID=A0AB33J9P4_9BACT
MKYGNRKTKVQRILSRVLILLACSLLLSACNEKEEDNGFPDEQNAVVFNGRVVNSDGIGIKDVKLHVDFIDARLFSSLTRKKSETKTDQNGNYQLKFYVRADEDTLFKQHLPYVAYRLTADASKLSADKYLLPEDATYQMEIYGRPDASEQVDCMIPECRKIDVTLTGFSTQDYSNNEFYISIKTSAGFFSKDEKGIRHFYSSYGKDYKATQPNVHYTIPLAVNDSAEVMVLRQKNGKGNQVWKKIYIGKTSPTSLTFDYNAAD